MKKANLHTAVLIFAHSSAKEASKKPFYKSEALFKILNAEVEQKAKKSGLPYFVLDENNQIGQTFGERFANAIQSIYNKGFENVIAVGNDSPQLKVNHIIEASKNVGNDKSVIGKNLDGGFYLLAINKAQFNFHKFQLLSWQTNQIFNEVSSILETSSQLTQLSSLKDLNDKTDCKFFINYIFSVSKKVLQLLSRLINQITNPIAFISTQFKQIITSVCFNKGSPLAISFSA